MPVTIHNKEYQTVAERVSKFRDDEKYQGYSIVTDIHSLEGPNCIIRASILDAENKIVATGFAHEVEGSSNINKTSHVENCETSAIGRALAALGLSGTEYASADEVAAATAKQAVMAAEKAFVEHTKYVLANYDTIMTIKRGCGDENLMADAAEAWFTLHDDIKHVLWMAPSKGGVFTTEERKIMQLTEFRQAYFVEEEVA